MGPWRSDGNCPHTVFFECSISILQSSCWCIRGLRRDPRARKSASARSRGTAGACRWCPGVHFTPEDPHLNALFCSGSQVVIGVYSAQPCLHPPDFFLFSSLKQTSQTEPRLQEGDRRHAARRKQRVPGLLPLASIMAMLPCGCELRPGTWTADLALNLLRLRCRQCVFGPLEPAVLLWL